jgi:chromosome partitioning protein
MTNTMTRIYAVCSQKGGVGKTTTVRELAAALSAAGQRVLVIDSDPQRNLTRRYGVDPSNIGTLYDALASRLMRGQEEVSLEDVIVADVLDGVDLVPGDRLLADVELTLVGVPSRRERFLARALTPLRKAGRYDVVVIDCPADLGMLTINALVAADDVLIPVDMTQSDSLDGAEDLVGTVRELEDDAPRLRALVRTRVGGSAKVRPLVLRAIEADMDDLPVPVAKTTIPATVKFEHAAIEHTTVVGGYDGHVAAQAYRDLAAELQNGGGR